MPSFIKPKSTESPTRKKSIFSFNSRDSTHGMNHDNSNTNGSSLFRRHRLNSPDRKSPAGNTRFFSLLGRNNNIESDLTIRRARKKVADAEKSGKEADTALTEARNRVREAQEHVQALEQEVLESAKAKQARSKNVRKSTKGFGRRGI